MKSKLPVELDGILRLLTEENAEVILAVSKAQRFGLDAKNPYDGACATTKEEDLIQEIGDVLTLILVLESKFPNIFTEEKFARAIKKKVERLKKYIPGLQDFKL